MKKIWVSLASIIGFCTSVLLICMYLERKRVERIIETEEKTEQQKWQEYLENLRESKKHEDECFIQDLKEGKINKVFYEAFKDLFNYPELPEGFVFPEDREPKA